MPSFQAGGGDTTPFGRREYRRSNVGVKTEPYTCASAAVPARTIDGYADQKILQPGTIMAKITTGDDAGKVGPRQLGVTDGRQDVANIVGVNDTFLPWQLKHHDEQIAVCYDVAAVQSWCVELDAAGAEVPCTNTTADAMRAKGLQVNFK